MKNAGPHFLLRAARPGDHRQLLALARELDSINLPTAAGRLRELLARSTRSFHGRIRDHAQAVYIFCAEEIATRRIVAASMIIGKHGTPTAPHYYLELDADERYSHTLRKLFRHSFLRLRYAMDGPTEIGGLIVTQAMRGHPERIGKLISWVRFLYIGRHLARFEKQVVAEMLAPMLIGIFFIASLQLVFLGVLGEYVGRVYDEVRSRPLSIISRVHRFPAMLAPQVGVMGVQADATYQNRNATEAA